MTNFYDQLTPFFHLVYKDWNASVHRQGEQLSARKVQSRKIGPF